MQPLSEPITKAIARSRIKFDKTAHTVEAKVQWQGRDITVKVQYEDSKFNFSKVQEDLGKKLQQILHSESEAKLKEGKVLKREVGKRHLAPEAKKFKAPDQEIKTPIQIASRGPISTEDAYKELQHKPVGSYLIRDSQKTPGVKEICFVNFRGIVDRISFRPHSMGVQIFAPQILAGKTFENLEKLMADPLISPSLTKPLEEASSVIAEPQVEKKTILTDPSQIILGPKFWHASSGPPTKQTLEEYHAIKQKFQGNKDINIKFDDKNLTITILHHEKEVEAILGEEDLNILGGSMTITRDTAYLTMHGKGSFVVMPEARERYIEQEVALMQEAEAYMEVHQPPSVEVDASIKTSNPIPALLSKYQGICIGEHHHSDVTPKQYLIENMQKFKEQGVTTLFFEHVFFDSTQKWLDDYFNSPKGSPMPPYLERYLENLSHGQMSNNYDPRYTYTEVVKAAKEQGVRIVAIDTTVSYASGADDKKGVVEEKSQDRYKAMNYVATKIMQQEAKGGKFIALMGAAHVGYTEGVPGVSELMGCPSVVIGETEGPPRTLYNVKKFVGIVEHVGVFMELPKPPKPQSA